MHLIPENDYIEITEIESEYTENTPKMTKFKTNKGKRREVASGSNYWTNVNGTLGSLTKQ